MLHIAKQEEKPTPSAPQPAPAVDLDAFRDSWKKEIKGEKEPSPKKKAGRDITPSPPEDPFFYRPSFQPPPPRDPILVAAEQQTRIAEARARLKAPRALLAILSSPSAAREFLTNPNFSRGDLGLLRRVCSPFSAPIQRIIFTK